jgi:glycosyltransferase involved in cell wall biosynthesis
VLRGEEDFDFPGSEALLAGAATTDVFHLHNLHGAYFDLRLLPQLAAIRPVVLTLHDAWLLSGHCAHSFSCGRWETGCGNCPDLTIYPSVPRDATAWNWRRKQRLFAATRAYVATPSRWLMDRVRRSMLWPAVAEAKVIPNGVDVSVFAPGDRDLARDRLGLPRDAGILCCSANNITRDPFKDWPTLAAAVGQVRGPRSEPLILCCLGESRGPERLGEASVIYARVDEPADLARWYQASDLHLHAARADTFPSAVLEAMASQIPSIASDVGGICEQIEDGVTGVLVPEADAGAMAAAIDALLSDDDVRAQMGYRARERATNEFDERSMVASYLDWLRTIVASRPLSAASR